MPEYYKLFATGNGAMLITAGDCPKQLVKYDMKPDQLGMFALPSGPARHVALLGGTLYSVSAAATEEQKDAVVRWIETKSILKRQIHIRTPQKRNCKKISAKISLSV